MATALTLVAAAVVIMRRCTSEIRLCGNRTKKIDLIAVAERLDRGAASIARSRHHDGPALAACRQYVIHQPRQQLHRQILECEGGAVVQFEYERIDVELGQGGHRGMAESAIGLACHAREIGLGDGVVDEAADDFDRDFRIGPAGERLAINSGSSCGPGLRHV